MTASAEPRPGAASRAELPESFTAIASPEVQALAAEWLASSRAHFAAMDLWDRTSNAKPDRNQVETECDIAIMEDEAVRRRILDLSPSAPGALVLKAAAFTVHLPTLDEVDMIVAEVVGDEGPSAEAFAFTLARDLVGVLGPCVRDLAALARPARPVSTATPQPAPTQR